MVLRLLPIGLLLSTTPPSARRPKVSHPVLSTPTSRTAGSTCVQCGLLVDHVFKSLEGSNLVTNSNQNCKYSLV